jgi:hypothetical protein
MGKLGISQCGNFSMLKYAIVQESYSTRTLAYYSGEPRYCETMVHTGQHKGKAQRYVLRACVCVCVCARAAIADCANVSIEMETA